MAKITFEDLKKKAKLKDDIGDRENISKNIFSGIGISGIGISGIGISGIGISEIGNVSPNVKCAKLVDIIFDKVIELMKKDEKMSGVKKYAVVRGAEGLKDPVKKYILLDMNNSDAVDMVERAKKELNN